MQCSFYIKYPRKFSLLIIHIYGTVDSTQYFRNKYVISSTIKKARCMDLLFCPNFNQYEE